ncbi:MAG: hypothetical protein HUU50_22630 [Candidatus Brocadiae bacterium]|nr:hypothetical protein [Candidatus Brocadiia bacterium]
MPTLLHIHPVIVQCADAQLMQEIMSKSVLEKYVVKKISDSIYLIDPEYADKIFDQLERKKYMLLKIQGDKE